MIKKLSIFAFVFLFSLATVSAWEFDNVKDYDKSTETISIINSFGFGGKIADIKMVDYNPFCIPSECYMNMELEVYDDGLTSYQSSAYYDKKRSRILDGKVRRIEIFDEEASYEESFVEFDCITQNDANKTVVCRNVEKTRIGYGTFIPYEESTKLGRGKYLLREKVDVQEGETVDLVPTFYGEDLTEWADFTGFNKSEFYDQNDDDSQASRSNRHIAQIFKVGTTASNVSYNITGVSMRGSAASGTAAVTLEIYEMNISTNRTEPTVQRIGIAEFNYTEFAVGIGWVNITLNDTGRIKAGKSYGIFMNGTAADTILWRWDSSSSAYAGGHAIVDDGANGVWADEFDRDFVFEVWGVGEVESFAHTPLDLEIVSNAGTTFNCSGTGSAGVTITNISVWTNSSGTFQEDNITVGLTKGFEEVSNMTVTFPNENPFQWSCLACGSNGNCFFDDENRTVIFDAAAPGITINKPATIEDLGFINKNETLNWSIVDANLDSVIYDYNGTNVSSSGSENETTFLIESRANNNLTLYANDSVGRENSTEVIWNYIVFENSQDFNNVSVSGAIEEFKINITTNSSSFENATLVYNNTRFDSDSIFQSGEEFIIAANITIPTATTPINKTFYWELKSGSNVVNSTMNKQLVSPFAVDDCSSFSTLILNYTIFDEVTKGLIPSSPNITLKVDVDIFALDYSTIVGELSFNTSNNNALVCLQTNLTNLISNFLDAQVQYSGGDGYILKFNHIQRQGLSNQTTPLVVPLFSINDSLSTEFILTFKNGNFIREENVLVDVTRKYIEDGIFRSVEVPKTDSNGNVILHLQTGDVIYSLTFKKNGELLTVLDNLVAKCDSEVLEDCTIDVNAYDSTISLPDFTFIGGIFITEVFNQSTRTLTTTFTSESGTRQVVQNVTKYDRFGNESICSNTITSSSGSLECVVADSFGNATILSQVYSDGEIVSSKTYSLKDVNPDTSGSYIIIAMLFIITASMMFVGDPRGILLGCFIGIVLATTLVYINGGSLFSVGSTITWAFITVGILIWKITQREER